MGDTQDWAAGPGAAQRARSVAAAAWSCAVTADGAREEYVGAHRVTGDGGVLLDVPEDSALVAAALCAPRGEPAAVVEFADVAPVPVRRRIRSRLWLAGWFTPVGGSLLLRPTRVVLWQPSAADPPRRRPPGRRRTAHPARASREPARRCPRGAARRRPARPHPAHRTRPHPGRRTAAVPHPRRRRRPAHRADARTAGPGERRRLPPRPTVAARRRRPVTRTAHPPGAARRSPRPRGTR